MMVVVPRLSDLLHARGGCRFGLPGLRVEFEGETWIIAWTRWNIDSELEVRLRGESDGDGPLVRPDQLTLLDDWACPCCRHSDARLRRSLARPRRRRRRT